MAERVRGGFSGDDIPAEHIAQQCIRCGFCLPHCPTYLETARETSSPRGRIQLIEAVRRGDLALTDRGFVDQMYQCLDCRACEAVCPSGVEYGKLVEPARTQIERAQPGSPLRRALRWLVFQRLFGDMRLFRLLSRLLYYYQRTGLQWLARHLGILRLLRLTEVEGLLPTMPRDFFRATDQHYASASASTVQRVLLFAGCIMSTVFAETQRATVRVLQAHNCAVEVPGGQGCCGALTIHAGAMEQARTMARRNIAAFEREGSEYILVNAAGCGSALKEYAYLLREDHEFAERAVSFSSRVRDISEFLCILPVVPVARELKLRVTYQEPCHLVHAQRIKQAPRHLLARIPDLELREMEESALCCGSAGIYNLTRPAMSRRLRERKVRHIAETCAEVVVTANPGCQLQLLGGLHQAHAQTRVLHLVDVLDLAYRSDETRDPPR